MEKAPYTPNPPNVKRFFQTVQTLGKPPKVSRSYLNQIGFVSSNDRHLPGLLKSLGFTDNSNVPTERWNIYKDKGRAGAEMALAIKSAYDELFTIYPDANKRDSKTIQNFFASKFGVSAKLAELMERTFSQLCALADFEAEAIEEPTAEPVATTQKSEKPASTKTLTPVTININIQLQLPATQDATIYDSRFQ